MASIRTVVFAARLPSTVIVTGSTLGRSKLLDAVRRSGGEHVCGVFTGAVQHVPSRTVDALVAEASWDDAHAQIRQIMLERFADVHSLALQQTLWEMGKAVLEARDDVAEIRLSAPNRHHFLANLAPFGLDNPGEVFHAADRPYGLIQATVQRDDAENAGPAWDSATAFA